MRTSKPFSTISYNSIPFLTERLNDLVLRGHISFYAFVKHLPEEDEKKEHIHLIMFPNGLMATDSLREYFCELETISAPPLTVMPFKSSKFEDWFLYSSHNKYYLASKGQSRKHAYTEENFYSNEPDYLHELIKTIDYAKYFKSNILIDAVKNRVPFGELVMNGLVPVPQFSQWSMMYNTLWDTFWSAQQRTERNGGTTHTPIESDSDNTN